MLRPHPDSSPNLDTSPNLETSRAGFTLIEIAVVLVILALAYGLVTPAFSNFVAATRLESATRELAMALKEARSTAIVMGRELRFEIDPTTPGWRFEDRHGAFDRRVAIRLDSATGASDSTITFFADGHSSGGRFMLEGAGRGRIVEIHWLTGRVTQSAY